MTHSEVKSRNWQTGRPPYIGWWNASKCELLDVWRWWDGKGWSVGVLDSCTAAHAAELTVYPDKFHRDIKWCAYWPEHARVKRVPPAHKRSVLVKDESKGEKRAVVINETHEDTFWITIFHDDGAHGLKTTPLHLTTKGLKLLSKAIKKIERGAVNE